MHFVSSYAPYRKLHKQKIEGYLSKCFRKVFFLSFLFLYFYFFLFNIKWWAGIVRCFKNAEIWKFSQGSHHIQSTSDWQIFERGCLRAGEEWMEANCFRVVVSVLTVGIFQVHFLHGFLLDWIACYCLAWFVRPPSFQCISVFCSLGILVLVVELLFLLHVPRIMMWGK